MKESHQKGVANHLSPESCLDDPRGRGEALTGESTGSPIELRNHLISNADPVGCSETIGVSPYELSVRLLYEFVPL